MALLLPVSFVHHGTPYRGILTSLNAFNNSFSLHINEDWVATSNYENNWVMDGRFAEHTAFIGEYIEKYF